MIIILTQCFPPAIGGIEHLMAGAAQQLTARGHDVRVLADGEGEMPRSYGDVRYFSGLKYIRNFRKATAVRKLVRTGAAQALLADSWKSLETFSRSKCDGKVGRVVCFAHGNEFPEHPSPRKISRIRKSLELADRIVANSQFTAARVRQYVDSDKIVVRAPAIDDIVEFDDADRAWAEDAWKGDHPRLLSLSRLEPLKGIDQVIFAIKDLLPQYPSLRYVIAGAGEDYLRLKALVEDGGLEEHVLFAGAVHGARKSALYSTADLFVMPTRRIGSRQEAFGMVYLEAALHGLPVIGGLAGGAHEAVIDGITGILVEGDEKTSVFHSIRQLLESPQTRGDMAKNAARFGAKHTWSEQIVFLEQDLGVSGSRDLSEAEFQFGP